jgi:hypothetical protein
MRWRDAEREVLDVDDGTPAHDESVFIVERVGRGFLPKPKRKGGAVRAALAIVVARRKLHDTWGEVADRPTGTSTGSRHEHSDPVLGGLLRKRLPEQTGLFAHFVRVRHSLETASADEVLVTKK